MADPAVVVTGLGVLCGLGNDVPSFSRGLFEGVNPAASVTVFDASRLPTRFAVEVRGFEVEHRDRKIPFALEAARQALKQAFGGRPLLDARVGLSVGLGLELFSLDDLVAQRAGTLPPPAGDYEAMTRLNTPAHLCVRLLGHAVGATVPPRVFISACAAGTDAIGHAFRALVRGRADVIVAGGTDSMINPLGMAGFCRIGAMSTRNDAPGAASRPFDAAADGFVLGEGAAFLVLEREASARARGAPVLARIAGYGASMDAHSVSDPCPDGRGAAQAMRAALASARLSAADVVAVSAHGTGTPRNDPAESAAIRAVVGPDVPVVATKSLTGHLVSAAGAVETVAVVCCMRAGRLHPTANLDMVAPGCELRHVLHPEPFSGGHVLKNSFGFGGQNACLVIGGGDS